MSRTRAGRRQDERVLRSAELNTTRRLKLTSGREGYTLDRTR